MMLRKCQMESMHRSLAHTEEQGQVSQSGKGKGRVAGREGAPAVVQRVPFRLGAHFDAHQDISRSAGLGLAARDEVRAGTADGVLEHVREEEGEDEVDGEPKQDDVQFAGGGAYGKEPERDVCGECRRGAGNLPTGTRWLMACGNWIRGAEREKRR